MSSEIDLSNSRKIDSWQLQTKKSWMKPRKCEVPKMEIGKEKEISTRTLSSTVLTALYDFLYD